MVPQVGHVKSFPMLSRSPHKIETGNVLAAQRN